MSDRSPSFPNAFFDDPASPWLLLAHVPGLGVKRWQAVCDAYTNPLDLLKASSATHKAMGLPSAAWQLLAAWQRRDESFPPLAEVIARFHETRAGNIALVGWGHDDYPEALRHIQDPPLVLYARGDTRLLARPQIAVVGSRNATRSGLDNAHSFSRALSQRGYLITSGLAQGIDGAAHSGALAAGVGTIAVIGTGVDVIYPNAHRTLTAEIIHRGLVISEFPPGTPPKPGHFPRRNRIISGLSRGILVVEASLRSGSLITARLALEQGREVFAIPGSIHNPLARGCHELIRQGARLVETVDDIEEELSAWWRGSGDVEPVPPEQEQQVSRPEVAVAEPSGHPLPEFLEPREIAVLKALGYDPRSTDQLCLATGLPADQLMQSLLTLEMEGLVASAPGGFQRLA
ncbi:DNA-processing protein DprA [uncultured Marinobacter sp.]|uniref:DNA-processing protein DprA n=1 Tax=uncultured Marinobacter sp. TaxID=187379 RepID=UPI0030D87054